MLKAGSCTIATYSSLQCLEVGRRVQRQDVTITVRAVRSEKSIMRLVSVIIPCYNQANFLCEAIKSIVSQTYQHFEIIVVNDGSSDNTADVAAHFHRIRYLCQNHQGPGSARNNGFSKSVGDYVVFLDADDRLLTDALETGLNCLDAHPECAFVYGHIQLIDADGSPLPTPDQVRVDKDHYLMLLYYNYIWTTGVVMFRRYVFDSISFDPSLITSGDWELYLNISRNFPVYGHGNVIAEHRSHQKNLTKNYGLMLKYSARVLHSQLDYVKGNKKYEEAYKSGTRSIKDYYGNPLVELAKEHFRRFEVKRAIQEVLSLLRYYPAGFIKLFIK